MPAATAVSVQKKSTPSRRSVPTKTKVEAKTSPVATEVAEVKSAAVKTAAPVKAKVNVNVNANVVDVKEEVETVAPAKVHVDAKKKRQRPRIRVFADVFAQLHEDINTAYKALQSATRALKTLESAHNREVGNTRSRANTHRTPTIVFDQSLVDYFTSRLDPSELTVNRKEQDGEVTVDLSGLDTDTRVHRTDATQLYNKAFAKHDLRDSKDRRFILYQNDPELVALLTQGYADPVPELQEEIQQIRDGTYKLSIFNIQRFTSHHLGKVALPPKGEAASETSTSETDTV
jgi:hypothetical protein